MVILPPFFPAKFAENQGKNDALPRRKLPAPYDGERSPWKTKMFFHSSSAENALHKCA